MAQPHGPGLKPAPPPCLGAAPRSVRVGLKHGVAPGDRSLDTPVIKPACSAGIWLVFTNYIALVNSAEDSVIKRDLGTAFLCSAEVSSASKWEPSLCFLFTASTLEKAVVSGIYSAPGSCSPCLCAAGFPGEGSVMSDSFFFFFF